MTVYELRAARDAIALACSRGGDYARVHDLGAQPVTPEAWSPLRVEVIRDGSGATAPSDLVMLGVEPAFTARAVEALQSFLFSAGQVLPLRSADGEFYLWNVTNVVDALDESRSTLARFRDGAIMAVRSWAFRPAPLAGVAAFKIPQLPRAFTFVTDDFLEAVRAASLRGFAPRAVWRSEDGVAAV